MQNKRHVWEKIKPQWVSNLFVFLQTRNIKVPNNESCKKEAEQFFILKKGNLDDNLKVTSFYLKEK